MSGIENNSVVFSGVICIIFGILGILYGIKIKKTSGGIIPWTNWVAYQFSRFFQKKEKTEILLSEIKNPSHLKQNGSFTIVGGVMLVIGGILTVILKTIK
jgi:hypothetical protein